MGPTSLASRLASRFLSCAFRRQRSNASSNARGSFVASIVPLTLAPKFFTRDDFVNSNNSSAYGQFRSCTAQAGLDLAEIKCVDDKASNFLINDDNHNIRLVLKGPFQCIAVYVC